MSIFCLQWLESLSERLAALEVCGDKKPNHVLVNEYKSGQGIMVSYRSISGYTFIELGATRNYMLYSVLNTHFIEWTFNILVNMETEF